MAINFNERVSNGLHEVHYDNDAGQFEPVGNFDWTELERRVDGVEPPEEMISVADASAAISIILGWICKGPKGDTPAKIANVGARAESLLLLLDPNQSQYDSLSDIADDAGITRAALSKSLLKLKDQSGLKLTIGKLAGTRARYRETQINAIEKGVHSSFKRSDLRASVRGSSSGRTKESI